MMFSKDLVSHVCSAFNDLLLKEKRKEWECLERASVKFTCLQIKIRAKVQSECITLKCGVYAYKTLWISTVGYKNEAAPVGPGLAASVSDGDMKHIIQHPQPDSTRLPGFH